MFICSIMIALIEFFEAEVEEYETERIKWLVLFLLVVGIVGFMITFNKGTAELHGSTEERPLYKQGQIDALEGKQHYKRVLIYHDSILVDTTYIFEP